MNVIVSSIYGRSGKDGISVHANFIENELSKGILFDYHVYLTHENISSPDKDTLIFVTKGSATVRTLIFAVQTNFGLNALRNRLCKDGNFFVFMGFHCVFLIPLLPRSSRVIFIPFDCWSARERRLASQESNLIKRSARLLWYRLIKLAESIAIPRLDLIGLISEEEIDSFKAEHPKFASTNTKFAVIPRWRPDYTPRSSAPCSGSVTAEVSVLIWMDCRTPYGLASVKSLARTLSALEPTTIEFLKIKALTRIGDHQFADAMRDIEMEFENLEFIDDIAAYLATIDVVILPDLFGSGVKNRTIQAIMSGNILFATPHAVEGIRFLHQEDYFPLENPGDLSSALKRVLANPQMAAEMSARARQALLDAADNGDNFVKAALAAANG
jgi:hypothetical protein